MQVQCIRHPKYDGKDNPDLRCRACCNIFVKRIQSLNANRAQDVAKWLESKMRK